MCNIPSIKHHLFHIVKNVKISLQSTYQTFTYQKSKLHVHKVGTTRFFKNNANKRSFNPQRKVFRKKLQTIVKIINLNLPTTRRATETATAARTAKTSATTT